jgi:hypothetical protein
VPTCFGEQASVACVSHSAPAPAPTGQQSSIPITFSNVVNMPPPEKEDMFDCRKYVGQDLKIRMASLSRYDFMRNIISFSNAKIDRYIESLASSLNDVTVALAIVQGKTEAQFDEQERIPIVMRTHTKIIYITGKLIALQKSILKQEELRTTILTHGSPSFAESVLTVFLGIFCAG